MHLFFGEFKVPVHMVSDPELKDASDCKTIFGFNWDFFLSVIHYTGCLVSCGVSMFTITIYLCIKILELF